MSAANHLRVLAAEPRPTGSSAAAHARAYCADTLRALDFDVRETAFEYSAIVGEYGTPLGGFAALAAIGGAALASNRGQPTLALALLLVALPVLALGGSWLARRGVLTLPMLRRQGLNLEAVRSEAPRLWLVAHIDSKSQPVPLLVRAAGIVLLGVAYVGALLMASMELWRGAEYAAAFGWRGVVLAGAIGAVPVLGSLVGRRSPGAVDNASGVATVLAAAGLLPATAAVGVLITDAEELGLAGARAWCAGRVPGIALNCDGVDDAGTLTLMWTRPRARRLEAALRDAAAAEGITLRIIPLIPGVLVDGVAFADAAWETITMSHGTFGTLRRIHTARDSLSTLRGDGAVKAARVLSRAVRALVGAT